jgi:hypothetical protein
MTSTQAKRVERLEQKTTDGHRPFWVVKERDGVIEYDGQSFPDLDAWEHACGVGEHDLVFIISYVHDWR